MFRISKEALVSLGLRRKSHTANNRGGKRTKEERTAKR